MSSLGCGVVVVGYLAESARKAVLRGFRSEPCVLQCVAPGVQLILEASPPSQTAVVASSGGACVRTGLLTREQSMFFQYTQSYCLLMEAIPPLSKSPLRSVAGIILLLSYLVVSFPMCMLDVSIF